METPTREPGKTIRCVERENSIGQMADTMKVTLLKIKNKVLAGCRCLTDVFTKVNGRVDVNMVKENTRTRTENGRKGYGRMEKE